MALTMFEGIFAAAKKTRHTFARGQSEGPSARQVHPSILQSLRAEAARVASATSASRAESVARVATRRADEVGASGERESPGGFAELFLTLCVHAASAVSASLILPGQNFTGAAGIIHQKENPMPTQEEAIRERAYHLWIADGQPEGRANIYWLNAQREILAACVESPAREVTAAATGPVATKSAKKRHDRGYAWRSAV